MSPMELAPATFQPDAVKNILVILRHRMGDTVLAFPMLAALRLYFPKAHITLVTKSSTNCRHIFRDNLFYCDEIKEYEFGLDPFLNLIHELRQRSYQLAVVPTTVSFSVTNHLIAYFSKAAYRVGVESFGTADEELNPCAFLLNIRRHFRWRRERTHQITRYLDVVRQLGIPGDDITIQVAIPAKNLEFARMFFKENFPDASRLVVAIHPGAGKPGNVWAAENFAQLISKLRDNYNPYFLISEGPLDQGYVQNLISLLEEKYHMKVHVHKGTLMDDLALISLCNLFVTNDTGIMHLAAGLDVQIVSLFGSTDPLEWAPIGEGRVSVQSPTGNINDIKVENVYEVCDNIIKTIRHMGGSV